MVSYRIFPIAWIVVGFLLFLVSVSSSTTGRKSRRNEGSTGNNGRRNEFMPFSRTSSKPRQSGTLNRGRSRHEHSSKSNPDVTVQMKKGKYQGIIFDILDTKVAGFLGMRYGQSTAGKMRFKKPLPVEKWSGTRNASSYSNSCFQWTDNTFGEGYAGTEMWNPNTEKSEDCLFLNVWTPLEPSFKGHKLKRSKKLLPVMVWIFGGGFYSGSSTLDVYQGQWLASSQNVVVVSMNYRVAALGFLALGIEEAPGNVGLWDQNLALQWIHENIHYFRGDKDRITLFGESAGAASVSMHMLSDKSNTLFQNAILQSASILSPWALLSKDEMRRRAFKLADELNCRDSSNVNESLQDVVSCLAAQDALSLVNTEIYMEELGTARFQNAAVIDEDFLTEEVINKLKDNTFATDINILAGFNGNEGNYFLVYSTEGFMNLIGNPISYSQYKTGLNKGLWGYPWSPFNQHDQQKLKADSPDYIMHAINFLYTDFEETVSDSMNSPNLTSQNYYKAALDNIVGDLNFVCPTIDFIQKSGARTEIGDDTGSGGRVLNSTKGRKYLYHFLHRSSQTPWPEWMGTLHGYEIEFAFGIPLNTSLNYTPQEVALSKKMLKYWSNFAKTGNPNGINGEESLTQWPEYDENSKSTLVFNIEGTNKSNAQTDAVTYVNKNAKDRHCQFWNIYYPLLLKNRGQGVECQTQASRTGSASVLTSYVACVLPAFVTLLFIKI